jgi:hypothetical protein
MATLTLADLRNIVEEFSPTQCDYFSEACSVAFQKNKHISETTLTVAGNYQGTLSFAWEPATSLLGWQDNSVVAENAAIAVAFFLITEFTEYTIVRQSIRSTGFDYWLGYKRTHPKFNPKNFLLARLEISGIFNGDESDLKQRVKKKLQQVDKSVKLKLPAFIAVTEFGKCKSILATK